MSLDSKIERWIKQSINKFFTDGRAGYTLILEGAPVPDSAGWVELRLTGPRYNEISKNYFRVELEINLAINIKLGPTTNLYTMEEISGHFRTLCDNQIPVKKYKDTNPAELINCLRLRNNVPNPLEVIPWGETNVQGSSGPVKVFFTTIDGYYKMEIEQ